MHRVYLHINRRRTNVRCLIGKTTKNENKSYKHINQAPVSPGTWHQYVSLCVYNSREASIRDHVSIVGDRVVERSALHCSVHDNVRVSTVIISHAINTYSMLHAAMSASTSLCGMDSLWEWRR